MGSWLHTLEIFLTEKHDCLTDEARFGGNGFKNVRLKCGKNVLSAGNKFKQPSYRIYSINRPGRLSNFWTFRVGAYSRLDAY